MGNSHEAHSRSQRNRSLSDTTLDISRRVTKTKSEDSAQNRANKSYLVAKQYDYIASLEAEPSESVLTASRSLSDFSSSREKVVIMKGWLMKYGETSKKLKKRYWKLYDNGTLKYNTKPSGSFKKYVDLKIGIDAMSLKDENGFSVEVSGRHLIFYAETSKERDAWFAIIYKHYFEKGKERVQRLLGACTPITPTTPRSRPKNIKYNHNNNNNNKIDERVIFNEEYMNKECDGKTCLSLERVHYVLKKYDKQLQNKMKTLGMYKYINNGLGQCYNNTHLLNDYNHLVQFHDNVFHHIYEYLSGKCEFDECLLIKRLHRDRDYYKDDEKRMEIYYYYNDAKEINTQQILDKIHCFYRHSYDLGFRVNMNTNMNTNMDKAKSYTLDEAKLNDDAYDDDVFQDEWKLLEICGLIKQKRNNLRVLRGTKRINTNKFISKVDKAQRYHYWKQLDDDDDKYWRIDMKYDAFKQEMLCNDAYRISVSQWQTVHEGASDHICVKRCRKIRATKYWAELYDLPQDKPDNMDKKIRIRISHLIAIMMYCNFDTLSRVFTDTFYKLNDAETDEALRRRHSNLFHFGRLLRELIECFGKKVYNKRDVFYHGITDDMMFIESTQYFYAPLSTTTSIAVAIAYSHNNDKDYLLELTDDDSVLGMARYFDCNWISDFGDESEKFFIGGYKPLKIHTVLDAVLGRNYINYLKALHIMDRMMQGYYFHFENESEEIKHIVVHLLITQLKTNDIDIDIIDIGIKSHRRIISRRISDAFHTRRISDDHEYDYFENVPIYITKLLHHYCRNVVNVCIDWSNMNEEESKGFRFWKTLLSHHEYQWIKLNIFLLLFPNLKELNVRNIKLSYDTIQDVYVFLSQAKCDNKYPDLYRIQISEVNQEQYQIAQCLEQYLEKFKNVGWTMTFNPFEDEMCILKL